MIIHFSGRYIIGIIFLLGDDGNDNGVVDCDVDCNCSFDNDDDGGNSDEGVIDCCGNSSK